MRLDKETFAGRGRSFVAFISRALVPGLFFVALVCAAQTARAQSSAGSNGMVISQVYTRGGEPGAAAAQRLHRIFQSRYEQRKPG